ncbi:MAG: trypsin-like peptidase domain-containing protein [Acidobacteria bacterium]|nr:trypsin-like peptidase domain-containing protein [Acidobacteriota bacterium]
MRVLWSFLAAGLLLHAQRGAGPLRPFSNELAALSAKVHDGIVLIRSASFEAAGKGGAIAVRQTGLGSGVIISSDGYIVTNAHVVGKSARVDVLLAPPKGARNAPEHTRLLEGEVIGVDEESDLAVVKIEGSGHSFLPWGDSEKLRQGEIVIAMGHPRGMENSVTWGIVSSTQRQLAPDARMVYIQTDAAINPGNSGGPLLDLDGRIIGINMMILSESGGSEGLGFAIPARIAEPVTEQLKKNGKVTRGDIGLTAQTLSHGIAQGLDLDVDTGVLVADVEPKSPAALAGIQPGDVILSVDGRAMESARQFHVFIYRRAVASVAKIEILRKGDKKTVEAVVLDRTEKGSSMPKVTLGTDNLIQRLRVLAVALDRPLLDQLPGLRKEYGILVAALVPGAYVQEDGLQPGDIIHDIAAKPISTLKDLRDALEPFKPRSQVVMLIERDGKTKFIEHRLE